MPTRVPNLPTNAAAVHRCFGDPPAQIATDTQSPPCIAYWAGDNGGATTRGVTGTTIRIALSANDFPNAREAQDLQTFFNQNFEFYGRSLQLVPGAVGNPTSCSSAAAMADGVAASQFFASTDPTGTADECYFAEAAHDHLLSTQYWGQVGTSSAVEASLAPYVFGYQMPWDHQFVEDAAFVCSQLAGKTARYAPAYALDQRKFGFVMVYDDVPWPVEPVYRSDLLDRLAACGAPISSKDVEVYDYAAGSDQSDANIEQFATTAMTQLHADGVTTVLCAEWCAGFGVGNEMSAAASGQDYYPEWVLLDTGSDYNTYVRTDWGDANESTSLFNISFMPPQVPYADEPLNRAITQVDPGHQISDGAANFDNANRGYEQILEIASGIQMAGPDLTPASFARGLQLASFPNPYSPQMEGVASFAGGSYAMTTDAVIAWWNNTAPSVYPDEGAGTWCYADGARRFTAAELGSASNILPPSIASAPCASSPPGS